MKKRSILLIVVLLSIFSACVCLAEEETATSMYYTNKYTIEDNTDVIYDFINSTDLEVLSPSAGIIDVQLDVDTYETMQKLGFTSLKVQRWNSTSWVTDREITNQLENTTNSFEYDNAFTGLYSGYQYRVKVTLRAKRAQGEVQDLTITSYNVICH